MNLQFKIKNGKDISKHLRKLAESIKESLITYNAGLGLAWLGHCKKYKQKYETKAAENYLSISRLSLYVRLPTSI